MGNPGKQAHDFYSDVITHNKMWTVRDIKGEVIFESNRGTKIKPVWSKITRVERIIKTIPEFSDLEPVEISWSEFENELAPKLKEKNIFVGVNWSGKKLTGYDMSVLQLIEIVSLNKAVALTNHSSGSPNGTL